MAVHARGAELAHAREAILSGAGEAVRRHTAPAINAAIDDAMRDRLLHLADASDEEIEQRIGALDREWDAERCAAAAGSSLALAGLALAAWRGRPWLLMSAVITLMSLQQAVLGKSAPVLALRRLGFRTRGEIARERYALKAVRGDFAAPLPDALETRMARVDSVLDAMRD